MTARQRQAPGSAAVIVPAETSAADGRTNGAAAPFRWEEWFAGASPDQRSEALALARQQGLLYLQQLPASTRREPAGASGLAPMVARLIAGQADSLPPLADEPLAWCDAQLDPLQREAVRRALNTPDVALLQGLPGTGKSRVVTEVVIQAARRGWRVLLLAPAAPAVDVVLERLGPCADVLPIRLLGLEENHEALPAWLRALTLPEQRRAFRERTLDGARRARQQAEETCQRRQREEDLWPELAALAERHSVLATRLDELAQRGAAIAGDVEREVSGMPTAGKALPSGPFAAELIELHRRTGVALGDWQAADKALQEKEAAGRREFDEAAAAIAALEPKCRARQERRWWTLAYWTGASALERRDALQVRRDAAEVELRGLAQARDALEAARRQVEDKDRAERQKLIRGETERHRQQLVAEESALRGEQEAVRRAWDPLVASLAPAEVRPAGPSAAEVAAARQRWQQHRGHDEERCQFARQWADYLDEAGEQLLPRLPALANVLAGPIAALGRGREWSEAADAPFDLLVIEDADRLTESELLRLVAHAPRLLLVSATLAEPAPSAAPRGPRTLHGLPPVVACWPRLWQALSDDLGRLAYAWQRSGDRLICQLAPVRPEDERHLEREGLADNPPIELHILSQPRARPTLARVSFPGSYTVPQATSFLYREMEELPIQPLGRTPWWVQTPEAWTLHLGPAPVLPTEVVDLGDGIRMALIADGQDYAGRAARIEFARADGWDRARAGRWLEARLPWHDRDRATFLQVPHRMDRTLADIVGPVLFADTCLGRLLACAAPTGAAVELVPVPTPRRPDWPRDGAGLEQDLAASRHGDRLPVELRAELPRKGIVNYLEAQALVRRLEQWAQSPAELGSNGKGPCGVLVLALYEAQAELLRRLVSRSPALQNRRFPLEITVPGQVRHRECDVLVLSLTRSHAHRCVPYGEDVADLALALTRPRHRALIFADPGTLARRAHWQGPLDHLDGAEAQLEGARLGRLVRHVRA